MNCENQHRFKLSDSHGNTLMVCVGLQPPTTGAASFRLVVESESVMHPLQLVSTSCNGASMELEMEMCSKRPSTRAPEEDDPAAAAAANSSRVILKPSEDAQRAISSYQQLPQQQQ